MKKIYSIVAGLLLTSNVWAQAPQKMSYQAVIRNSSDALIKSTQVGMKISVLQGSATGTVAYAETQTPTTNANGLVSLELGKGTVVTGTFNTINWANGPYFIKTETDPTGGTTYTVAGTSELMSVPYALFAANSTPGPAGPTGATGPAGPTGATGPAGSGAGLPNGAAAGNTPYWNGTAWVTNSSNIFNNGSFVGLGTTSPSNPLSIQHNYVGGGIMNSGNGANHPSYVLANNGTEAASIGLSNGTGIFINNSQSGDITFRNSSATRGILFSTGGTPFNARLAISANGNVGIGTTSPSTKLDVVGSIKIADGTQGNDKVLTSDSNGLASWKVVSAGLPNGAAAGNTPYWNGTAWVTNSSNIFNNGGNIGIGTTSPSNALQLGADKVFRVDGYASTSTSNSFSIGGYGAFGIDKPGVTNGRFVVTNSGNVGIGVASPDASLSFDGTGQKIHFLNSQTNGYSIGIETSELRVAGGTGNLDAITFKTQGYNGTERMRINGAGNVGIGTATPSAKLDIVGNVKIFDGTQGKGKVLTSDSLGVATWSTPMQINMSANLYGLPTFNLINATDTVIHFGNVPYLSNMLYQNGAITIQYAGVYHFDLAIQFDYVYGNPYSVKIQTFINNNFTFDDYTNDLSKDIKLNAGDVVTFKIRQSSGVTRSISGWSRLNCHKVY